MTGCYVHDICGRLRVKTPFIKRNSNAAAGAHHFLKQITGTRSITVNPLTGSIVIYYDPKTITSQFILRKLHEAGYIELSKTVTRDPYIYTAAVKTAGVILNALAVTLLQQTLKRTSLSWIAVLI